MDKTTYKQAGVDIDEGARAVAAIKDAVHDTYTPEVIGDIGGFGGLFSAAALRDMEDPILVSGTDGVGTKLELAKRLGRHDTVGIDLVAMCANDIVTCGARPLFFLDYLAIGKLTAEFAREVVGGIAQGCKQAGCALIGGEMAEHPGVMGAGEYDISGFCVGAVDRANMIGPDKVCEHDIILGMASSGLHSNGYSLVRRVFTDNLDDAALREYADELMVPTCMYVKPLLHVLGDDTHVHAAAHITGGGITENLNRALPAGTDAHVRMGTWDVPPIIQTVVDAAGLSADEAFSTFNMGIGMALIVDPKYADEVAEALNGFYPTYNIGEVLRADDVRAPGQVVYDA